MRSQFELTREMIEFKINLNVILGELEEEFADIWIKAIRSLSDEQIAALIRITNALSPEQGSKFTLRYLMENYYPFRELVLYQTDDEFKRRMGLLDYDGLSNYS
jgi:hypothetical protein